MKIKKHTPKVSSIGAFTLIELLAVIAIVGVLAAILIPAIGAVRTKANISQSVSNLRQMGTYLSLYSLQTGGELPITTFTTSRNWVRGIWNIAYPDQELRFAPDSQGRVLYNTIFYTPLFEIDKSLAGETVRSYGWNSRVRTNFRGNASGWPMRSNVEYPSRSFLVGDTTSSSALAPTNGQINYRNNGQAAFLFVDGHVELRTPEEVPTDQNHVFWGGDVLSSDEE